MEIRAVPIMFSRREEVVVNQRDPGEETAMEEMAMRRIVPDIEARQ